MPLTTGAKLGPYEILAPIGAGGMGEVYRALDTHLDREVAVKVLPHAMASDPERLARFDREAKILAALNHPNIAVIFGLETFAGGRALVMELIAGETLSDRIKRGALPVEEACKVVTQMAEALEAAHEKGIVHRDLKPGNVMITSGGTVKVLDFGLAAMAAPAGASADPVNSPTITMGMTQAGTIMGTAAYMSPEQASGLPVDKRSDIWAYGVVLWEMLTGKRLFGGATVSHTLADVLRAPIDVETVPAPAPLKKLLRRCLDREPRTRLRDMGEARVAIAEYLANPNAGMENASTARESGVYLPWAAALLLPAIMAGVWWARSAPAAQDRPLIRLSVDLGPDADRDVRVSAVLSPDGSRIVYTAKGPGGFHQLYTRRLDQSTATLLTPDAVRQTNPFFSPNGEWVVYWTGAKLMKVPAQGGEPVAIGATPSDFNGASWGDDDNIIMGSDSGLWRIPSRGGTAEQVKGPADSMSWPHVLPGAQAVLIQTALSGVITHDTDDIDVVQLATGEKKNLVHGGYWPRYLPTNGQTGHLVYLREGALYGVAFDPRSLRLSGTPTRLLNDVAADNTADTVSGQFAFSNNGTFVYLSGKPQDATYPISWLDASGKVTPVVAQRGAYGSPRISTDGKLLAYTAATNRGSGNGSDLWVYDLARGTPTQLTFAGEVLDEIAWARDSKHLVYQDGKSLWWVRSDGGGQKQRLLDGKELGPAPLGPRSFSFGPSRLAFSPARGGLPDIWTMPVDVTDPEQPKPGKPEAFLAEPIVEVDPAFSPDGKFLAYSSNESGQVEIFVRPFPGPGGKWKVSTASPSQFPAWSAATHEIFFLGPDDRIMVTSYTIQGDSLSAGVPRVWSPTPIRRHGVQLNFDISPDGKRVIMFPQAVAETSTGNLHATFLLNFFDELRRRIPTGK